VLEINKVYNMDCLEGLKLLPDESINLILTDPPYNINYQSNRGSKEYKERINYNTDWDKNFDFSLYFNEFWRVLKDNSFFYVFGRWENFETMKKLGFKKILIWNKQHTGMGDLNCWGIGYELIFVFKKGKPIIRGKRPEGVLNIQHVGFFDKTIHPTQKPIKLLRYIINKSSDEGDVVLDGFSGSGSCLIASKQLNRRFIGFEISGRYCDLIKKQLKQQTLKGVC
jgi:site-specific DNA-methyltransferase (adenine-specific)